MRITSGEHSNRKPRIQPAVDERGLPAARTEDAGKNGLTAADRIEISGEARGLQAAQTNPAPVTLEKTAGPSQPELDPVYLEGVRKKLENGYYDTAEITHSIAERMLDLLGLKRSK